jgi:hypothetical protein
MGSHGRGRSARGLAAGALLLVLSGCSVSTTRDRSYATASAPNVQDCIPFVFGHPTLFACPGGKVYTEHQLQNLPEAFPAGVRTRNEKAG